MIEQMLADICQRGPRVVSVVLLRYFNPIGAHESGLIGEDPNGIPNNLMPYIAQVAVGQAAAAVACSATITTRPTAPACATISMWSIWPGAIWPRCIMRKACRQPGVVINLGTGSGYSVLEMVHAFEKASGRKVPYRHRAPPPRRYCHLLCRSHRSRRSCWAGRPRRPSTTCAATAGAMPPRIRDDLRHYRTIQRRVGRCLFRHLRHADFSIYLQ